MAELKRLRREELRWQREQRELQAQIQALQAQLQQQPPSQQQQPSEPQPEASAANSSTDTATDGAPKNRTGVDGTTDKDVNAAATSTPAATVQSRKTFDVDAKLRQYLWQCLTHDRIITRLMTEDIQMDLHGILQFCDKETREGLDDIFAAMDATATTSATTTIAAPTVTTLVGGVIGGVLGGAVQGQGAGGEKQRAMLELSLLRGKHKVECVVIDLLGHDLCVLDCRRVGLVDWSVIRFLCTLCHYSC